MRIAIGSEHRGNRARSDVLKHLRSSRHEVEDLGGDNPAVTDCLDVACLVAGKVARGECDVGILISGSGIEMCMAANKVCGIRAAVVQDEFVARRTRERHCCNVLCLGAGLEGVKNLERIVDAFLSAKPDPEHCALVAEKLTQIEQTYYGTKRRDFDPG